MENGHINLFADLEKEVSGYIYNGTRHAGHGEKQVDGD